MDRTIHYFQDRTDIWIVRSTISRIGLNMDRTIQYFQDGTDILLTELIKQHLAWIYVRMMKQIQCTHVQLMKDLRCLLACWCIVVCESTM